MVDNPAQHPINVQNFLRILAVHGSYKTFKKFMKNPEGWAKARTHEICSGNPELTRANLIVLARTAKRYITDPEGFSIPQSSYNNMFDSLKTKF